MMETFVAWEKCFNEKVPVIIHDKGWRTSGIAWVNAEQLGRVADLGIALGVCRKKRSFFCIDCDRDALLHHCEDYNVVWKETALDLLFVIQESHDIRMLFSADTWKNTYAGLIPAILRDAKSQDILMLAWMDRDALAECVRTGFMCFYSRSRKKLWRKGEESGNQQVIKGFGLYAGGNLPYTFIFDVEQLGGAACHDGYRSCFYRRVTENGLEVMGERVFDPAIVYNKKN